MVKMKKEDNPGTGYVGGFSLLFSTVLTNDEIIHLHLLGRLQQLAKRSDRQVSRYKRAA